MRINPIRLISIWLMTILITIILTAMVVHAAEADPEPATYEVISYKEYVVQYEPSESPTTNEIFKDKEQVKEDNQITRVGQDLPETFKVTAYCPCEICCGQWSDGFTYSGELAHEGVTIAADPSVLPLGTIVEIKGIGQRIVQDIGGAIEGNEIDIFFYRHEAALQFGIQYLEVIVID